MDKDKFQETYREETIEHLSELEATLLQLETNPHDPDLIDTAFRAMHTIKGSGAMFGFDEIAAFTHHLETVYELVRDGKVTVNKELIDITLASCDLIRGMINCDEIADKNARLERIISDLQTFMMATAMHSPKKDSAPSPEVEIPAKKTPVTYRVRFHPNAALFKTGTNPLLLLHELHTLGECRVLAITDFIPLLDELDPEDCYVLWDIILTTDAGKDAIKDIFIFVEDISDISIQLIDDEDGQDEEDGYKKLGEILVDRRDTKTENITQALVQQKKLGEILSENGDISSGMLDSALAEQAYIREKRQIRKCQEVSTTIRVPAEKLDNLVNMVGELVTLQSRLSQTALNTDNAELGLIAEEMERLTADLRDNAMGMRMLPIGTTFSKFQRLVRDLSRELGKEVELSTEGAETELDKTVIEKISDPLVHLIRNCIDHGIEAPELREKSGKTRQGRVHLSARHEGAHVLIRISDDGCGLDKDAILAKAVERGILTSETVLSDKELFELIFAPGFSTAKVVSDVSGRGVGMDVVKKNIEALQGSVDIESTAGQGTSITLKLPLTLAIIDGLLVKIERNFFVLPLSAIDECVELSRKNIEEGHGRHHINIRGEVVPYINLRSQFAIAGCPPSIEQVLITQIDGGRVGFVVDEVIGQHQTVIKSLGRMYRGVDEISGATVLGDGTVSLILDLNRIVQKAEVLESGQMS